MIREINDANTILVTFFGFLLNFITIWMISRHTQQEMLVYSQILLQTCIADILAICCNALVQPVFFSDNGVGTVWSFGPIHMLPNPWQCAIFMLFVFMFRFSTVSISSLFLYRYLVVNRNITMTIRRYACLLVAFSLPVAILVGSSFLSNCPTAENGRLKNDLFAAILGLDNETMQNYVVTMRANSAKDGAIFTATFAMALSICSYLCFILCGISIQVYIRQRYKGPTMASKRQVNCQITIVLCVQALIPMISLLPQLVVNALIRFKFSNGLFLLIYIGMLASTVSTWITVLNPLATLIFVRAYRTTLIGILCTIKDYRIRRRNPLTARNMIMLCRPNEPKSSNDDILPEESEHLSEIFL